MRLEESGSVKSNVVCNLQSQTIAPLAAIETYIYDSANRLFTSIETTGGAA